MDDDRGVIATGLLQATTLPFIVPVTTIGLQLHAITAANTAALVAAGLLSVIMFPAMSLSLLRRPPTHTSASQSPVEMLVVPERSLSATLSL